MKIGENCYWLEKPIVDEIEGSIICYSSKHLKILKHSFNIISLIEVGDYVNEYKVIEKGETRLGQYKYVVDSLDRQLFEENIESIVTYEQFNSIKYVLGE